jgi:hypothetical protein
MWRPNANGEPAGVSLEYAVFVVFADAVDDLEAQRKATENRIEALCRTKGLDGSRWHETLNAQLATAVAAERRAVADLEDAALSHPLVGPFIARTPGIGAKGIGRLVGTIGDPATRTLAQLRAYCGHGDPDRSHLSKEVVRFDDGRAVLPFNPKAKTRLWVVSESAYRQGVYRQVYLDAKAVAATKTHTKECRNTVRPVGGKAAGSNGCGIRAHPEWGAVGSPWRPGHQHAHALRLVGKAILRDLWQAATA